MIYVDATLNKEGGSGSGDSGNSEPSTLRRNGRFVFNDLTSKDQNDVMELPFQLINGGLVIQNQSHAHTTKEARSIVVYRPSTTQAVSGVKFESGFGMALGEGSYSRCIVKLFNTADTSRHQFVFGYNSSTLDFIANAGVFMKVQNNTFFIEYKGMSGAAVTATTPIPFTSFGVWLDFEMEYTADDTIAFKVSDLATKAVIFEQTITDANIPNYSLQGSGALVKSYTTWKRSIVGTGVDEVAFDYVGFTAG